MKSEDKSVDLRAEEQGGTEDTYEFNCEVKVIRQTYREIDDGKTHETKSVILIPNIEDTSAMMFLNAWLPDVFKVCTKCGNDYIKSNEYECNKCGSDQIKMEWTECPTFLGYPVAGPCRMAVVRKNNYCEKHHLFVMSTGPEEELLQMDGKKINVKVFPGTMDHIADKAGTINRTAKQI